MKLNYYKYILIVFYFVATGSLCAYASEKIRINNEIMSFEDAVPVISNMLSGPVKDKVIALNYLIPYGSTLSNKFILHEVYSIAISSNNFTNIDLLLSMPLNQQKEYRNSIPKESRDKEYVQFNLKLLALCIFVNIGSDSSKELFAKHINSDNVTERYIANSISEMLAREWEAGRMNVNAKRPNWLFSMSKETDKKTDKK